MDAEFRVARLERLADLLKKGIISETEFADEKRKLLATGVNDFESVRAEATKPTSGLGKAVESQADQGLSDDPIELPIETLISNDQASVNSFPATDEDIQQSDGETLRPKLWRFVVGCAGIFLLGDALGLRQQSLVLIGSLICGAAYLYQKRDGIVSWLPSLHVRSAWAAGLFFIVVPLVAGSLPLASSGAVVDPSPPAVKSDSERADFGSIKNGGPPDEIPEEQPSKMLGRTTYLAGCRVTSESQTGYGECLANMDDALKECDIFRNRNDGAYKSCLRQISDAYHF